MHSDARHFSLPSWRATRWLTGSGEEVPDDIRAALIASLFGTLPIFIGGVLNTLLVSGVIALRMRTAPFVGWFAFETAVCAIRLAVLMIAFRRADARKSTPTDSFLLLGLLWASGVGYGAFICMVSGDWVCATVACMSAGGMAGGICFRNYGAPRLAATMILLSLGPTTIAAPLSGQPILLITLLQIPLYLMSMRIAACQLRALLVSTMRAEREHEHEARHDPLTGLNNRTGLMRAMADRRERRMALLYLDLDGFKSVNDGHGHAAGDELLQRAADRLKSVLRAEDVAARIGGDEFIVIAQGVDGRQAPAFADRLIGLLGEPYVLQRGLVVRIGVSIGVALTPDHGQDVSELLDTADAALYSAKTGGKSRCVVAPAPVQWASRSA